MTDEPAAGIPEKAQQCVDCGALALKHETACAGCGGEVRPFAEVDA